MFGNNYKKIMNKYPLNIDCVWIATDDVGYLGAFVTAGIAPIPKGVLNNKFMDIFNIENRICELPKLLIVTLLTKIPRPDDFVEMAARGFFVYDWSDTHRTLKSSSSRYELVAVPDYPTTIVDLPSDFLELVTIIKFNNLIYAL